MLDPEVPTESGVGNSRTTPASRDAPRKNWFFTWNNYSEDDERRISEWCGAKCSKCIIGREVGESGTPHLQGTFCLKSKARFSALAKLWPKVHWEKTWCPERALAYCRKDGDLAVDLGAVAQIRAAADPLAGRAMFAWQTQLLEHLKTVPDDRTILWLWEPTGCAGKTAIAKHLCVTRPREVLFLGGKGSDIKFGIQAVMTDKKAPWVPKVCIFHYTRSVENFVSYEALESVKDGIFFSTKYEAGMVVFDSPHVVVFANFEPDRSKLSLDRWTVLRIDEASPGIPGDEPDCEADALLGLL